jgi:MFS transporter, ACS family, tartrate transporter
MANNENEMKIPSAAEGAPQIQRVTLTPSEERALLSKVTWRLIPLFFFCYIIAYIDRINIGFAKLHLREVLGVDETIFGSVYGFGAGLFFIGYFIFEVPSNLILQRVGARVWIARIMIVWGIVAMAFMFLTGTTMFYVMRFLLGTAEASRVTGN